MNYVINYNCIFNGFSPTIIIAVRSATLILLDLHIHKPTHRQAHIYTFTFSLNHLALDTYEP